MKCLCYIIYNNLELGSDGSVAGSGGTDTSYYNLIISSVTNKINCDSLFILKYFSNYVCMIIITFKPS